jgi:hypothetical protein
MPGKKTKPTTKNAIIAIKNSNPELNEKGIRKALRARGIKEGSIPKSDKTIYNIIKRYEKKFKLNPVDGFWSLDASMKHNIPYDIDKILVEVTEIYDNIPPTIRVARWIARLYPLLKDTLIKAYPDNRDSQIDKLMDIALAYAYHEQLAEAKKIENDTYDLDKIYLIKKDIKYVSTFSE